MARIKIENIKEDAKISNEDMKLIMGGISNEPTYKLLHPQFNNETHGKAYLLYTSYTR